MMLKKFALGGIIAIATVGIILGTVYLCALYQSWMPAIWVATAIIFPPVIYLCASIYDNARTQSRVERSVRSTLRFAVRLWWRHIVLAAYLFAAAVVAFIVILSTFQSAAKRGTEKPVFFRAGRLSQTETEKFVGFMNSVTAPVQFLWGGLLTLWLVLVFLAVLFFEQVSKWFATHNIIAATVAIALYLVWLVINVRKLWNEEFCCLS